MWISNQIILDKLSFWINGIVPALDDKHWLFTWLFTIYCLAAFRDLNLRVTVAFTAGIFPVVLLFLAIRLKKYVPTCNMYVGWQKTFFFSFKGRNKAVLFSCFHLWSFSFLQFHNWLRLIKKSIELLMYTPNLHIIILDFRQ